MQSGFGRTGTAWGFERLELVPDLGKPMGNGLPISAVLGSHEVFANFGAQQRYFNTFAGTAVPIAAAEVVLSDRARSGGVLLHDLLIEVLTGSRIPATVRANGLMVGVDFEVDTPVETAVRRAEEMVELLYEERILVSSTGRAGTVVKVRPPLVITDEQLRALARGFARSLTRLDERELAAGQRSPDG